MSPINRYAKVHVLWFTDKVIIIIVIVIIVIIIIIIVIIISHDSTSSSSVGAYFAFALLWFTVSQ